MVCALYFVLSNRPPPTVDGAGEAWRGAAARLGGKAGTWGGRAAAWAASGARQAHYYLLQGYGYLLQGRAASGLLLERLLLRLRVCLDAACAAATAVCRSALPS